jgi:hypothetical protein
MLSLSKSHPSTPHRKFEGAEIAPPFSLATMRFEVMPMSLEDTLKSVWRQVMVDKKDLVEVGQEACKVIFLRAKKLKMVEFKVGDFAIAGIEQNPKTTSRWAELARQGKRIMQFRCKGHYIANVCEAKLLRYPSWHALGISE